MEEKHYRLYEEELQLVIENSKQLSKISTYTDNPQIVLEEVQSVLQQWQSLVSQYRLVIEFGYESNKMLPKTQRIVKEIEQRVVQIQRSGDVVHSHEMFVFAELLDSLHRLLSKERLIKSKYNKEAFLVRRWTFLLSWLEKLSIFYFIRKKLPSQYISGNYRFVDYWLSLHTLLAFIYVVIAGIDQVPSWVKYTLLIYGCLRMFEVLIYQLNVILVHPYNTANYSLNSYRRMTIALIHNFFEIIFWFAGTFVTLQFIADTNAPMAVYTSFTHMVTYSMDIDETKWSIVAVLILQFQALTGVFMTILSFARFVSLFPQPASTDPMEQEANEQRHHHLVTRLDALEVYVLKSEACIIKNSEHIAKNAEAIERLVEEQKQLIQKLESNEVVRSS